MPRIEVTYNAEGILCTRDWGNGMANPTTENSTFPARLSRRPTRSTAEKEPHMAKEIPIRWLLIVTGSTLRAEEMDRPLGYYLKQRIEDSLSQATANGQSGLEDYLVRIVADFRWIHDEPLQSLPTISLGGPGVNALSHRWLEEVPVSLAFSERYFIQMDPDLAEPRVSIWGMDNSQHPNRRFRVRRSVSATISRSLRHRPRTPLII